METCVIKAHSFKVPKPVHKGFYLWLCSLELDRSLLVGVCYCQRELTSLRIVVGTKFLLLFSFFYYLKFCHSLLMQICWLILSSRTFTRTLQGVNQDTVLRLDTWYQQNIPDKNVRHSICGLWETVGFRRHFYATALLNSLRRITILSSTFWRKSKLCGKCFLNMV